MKDRSTLHLTCSALGVFALATGPPQRPTQTTHTRRWQRPNTRRQPPQERARQDRAAGDRKIPRRRSCGERRLQPAVRLRQRRRLRRDGPALREPGPVAWTARSTPSPAGNRDLRADAEGRPRLIGADYIVDAAEWDKTHIQAPELNGQIFHYFPAPNRFGLMRSTHCTSGRGRTTRPARSSTGTTTCPATRSTVRRSNRRRRRSKVATDFQRRRRG